MTTPQPVLLLGIFPLALPRFPAHRGALLSVLLESWANYFCLAALLVAPEEALTVREGPGVFLHRTFAWSGRFWLTQGSVLAVCARMALQTWQAASLGLVPTPPKNPINSDTRSDEVSAKTGDVSWISNFNGLLHCKGHWRTVGTTWGWWIVCGKLGWKNLKAIYSFVVSCCCGGGSTWAGDMSCFNCCLRSKWRTPLENWQLEK